MWWENVTGQLWALHDEIWFRWNSRVCGPGWMCWIDFCFRHVSGQHWWGDSGWLDQLRSHCKWSNRCQKRHVSQEVCCHHDHHDHYNDDQHVVWRRKRRNRPHFWWSRSVCDGQGFLQPSLAFCSRAAARVKFGIQWVPKWDALVACQLHALWYAWVIWDAFDCIYLTIQVTPVFSLHSSAKWAVFKTLFPSSQFSGCLKRILLARLYQNHLPGSTGHCSCWLLSWSLGVAANAPRSFEICRYAALFCREAVLTAVWAELYPRLHRNALNLGKLRVKFQNMTSLQVGYCQDSSRIFPKWRSFREVPFLVKMFAICPDSRGISCTTLRLFAISPASKKKIIWPKLTVVLLLIILYDISSLESHCRIGRSSQKWKSFFPAGNITQRTLFVLSFFLFWKEIPAHLLDEALLQDDDAEPLGCG